MLYEPPAQTAERRPRTDWAVFGTAAAAALAFVVWGMSSAESLAAVSSAILGWLVHNGGWAFVLAASGFVVFALWIAFSRFGKIRLGRDDEEPEFRTFSWIAMMFATGMGIGLMFYGVNEPIAHYTSPPPGSDVSTEALRVETALGTTLFHWALHPWAIYAVVGLAIAYGTFRRGRRQLISSAFAPLFGAKNVRGTAGKAIDVMAIFATLFGSATSLGLGALQIVGGFEQLGWVPEVSIPVLVTVIAVLTLAFVASAVSGIARGIQWLSNINMVLMVVFLIFIFVVGPSIFLLNLVPTTIASYLNELVPMAGRTEAFGGQETAEWLATWTVFYWAWWISWTPFVGMFIARISRGRTIRQFVAGLLLVPSLVSLIWFVIFGGTGIRLEQGGANLGALADSPEAQLFTMLQAFPWDVAVSVLVIVLVAIFFVTGADSASIVMGTLSQRGSISPQRPFVITWGVLIGAVAAVMLLVGGDTALSGLQQITIIVAAPFTVVMVLLCVALYRDLRSDPVVLRGAKGSEVVEAAVISGATTYGTDFQLEVSPVADDADPGSGAGSLPDGPPPADGGADSPPPGPERP
nr:BCCT family transporter [Allonocardiopsis opalescens]